MSDMKKHWLVICSATALAGCATTADREMVTLVAPADGGELMKQCSRYSPEGASNFFEPTPREITGIESAAMRTLRDARAKKGAVLSQAGVSPSPFDWPDDPSLYQRQYIGYVANGRRMIYGNYFPGGGATTPREPLTVCDGGPSFFGVEYDIDADKVVRIAFNGGRGGPFLEPIEP